MRVVTGNTKDIGGRFCIVVSRFNEGITSKLLEGALETLKTAGVDVDKCVTVVHVPGAFEVPVATMRMAKSKRFGAVISLSCVIRGGTPHFDYLAGEVTRGLGEVALKTGVPVAFGVLTTDTVEQAEARVAGAGVPAQHHPGAGTVDDNTKGNKGAEAAAAALEMFSLWRELEH